MPSITRRNFVNGNLMAVGALLAPMRSHATNVVDTLNPAYYPPSQTGLRGSHEGSNTHAHSMALDGKTNWGPRTRLDEVYDLVVVGGGISGLAAAYFYQQRHGGDKKVLILDNHNDFGGHANRNEHTINGQTRLTYGGSQTLVDPLHSGKLVREMLTDIGIDLERFKTAYDAGFYKRHNLVAATYFNKSIFGEDKVVKHPFCNYPNYVEGIQTSTLSDEEAVQQTPLSPRGKQQLLRILKGGLHAIDAQQKDLQAYIRNHDYFDYLKNTLEVDDPGVMRMARNSGLDWGTTGTDLMTIAAAMNCGAMGFARKAVYDEANPYIHHFPDGNAGMARALVKKLIPQVAKGKNAEELVLAKFHYNELDKSTNTTRVRLNSTVVNVSHAGRPKNSSEVLVSYIQNNKFYQLNAKGVVLACYNRIIPHIVPELPEKQATALSLQTKSPLQYTSVGLKNWRAMKETGIGLAMSPGNMHQAVLMDFPVKMGGYEFSDNPDSPCVIQMISCPFGDRVGAPRDEQFSDARHRMLGLRFEDYEDEIREHLGGMFPEDLFKFDREVESITVNRWAHGYSVGGPGDSTRQGRQPFGRITIANSDSAPGADALTAVKMAARAVQELG